MEDPDAWALEERLWLDGPAIFEAVLDPECLMAFPGMGVLRVPEILDGLRSAPRWVSVEMSARATGRAGEGVIVLGYAAEARREGAEPYRCVCTSTYIAEAGAWKLVQHQQSPD